MIILQVVILMCLWEEVSSGSFYSHILANLQGFYLRDRSWEKWKEKESTLEKGKITIMSWWYDCLPRKYNWVGWKATETISAHSKFPD